MPQGATPRTLKVHLSGDLTRSVKPGDAVTISGIFLPEPFTGFRAMRAGLVTNTFLEAQAVALDKKSYADIHMTPEQRATIAVRLLSRHHGRAVTHGCQPLGPLTAAASAVSCRILLYARSKALAARGVPSLCSHAC